MLQELVANHPSHTELLRRCMRPQQLPDGKSHHGLVAKRMQLAQRHWSPSVTVQAVTARRMGCTSNSQNCGQEACFAAIGWDGASHRAAVSPQAPQPSHEQQDSHPTATCRVPPSGRTPQGSGNAQHQAYLEEGYSCKFGISVTEAPPPRLRQPQPGRNRCVFISCSAAMQAARPAA
jgi:hypothetical protein